MLDFINIVFDYFYEGDLLGVNKEFDNVKVLLNKWNKVICFVDKSFVGWVVVEEYEFDELVDDLEDEKKLWFVERRVFFKICLCK